MPSKNDILAHLSSMQTSGSVASKAKILTSLEDTVKQRELPKSEFLNKLGRNTDLAHPEKIKFESEWAPKNSRQLALTPSAHEPDSSP